MEYHLSSNHNISKFDTKFCAQCLENLPSLRKVQAYCKQCREYICTNWCLKQHSKNRLTKKHDYLQNGDLKVFLKRSCDTYVPGSKDDVSDDDSDDETVDSPPRLTAILKTEYDIRDATDKEVCSIHATASLPNGRIVIADLKNSNIKLYDLRERMCLDVYKLENGTRDICASNKVDNEIYAVESGIPGIHQFQTGECIKLLDTINTDRECFGITCWSYGIAVVVSADMPSRGKYELRLLNYSGRVMKKVTTKTSGLEFSLPWYLCSNQSGEQIYMSDYGTNSVTAIDVNGNVICTYKDDDLNRPVSMATNEEGDVFMVGQRSHNIHHLSGDFVKKGIVYSEETFDFPGGIAYDANRDVFYVQCTGWSDRIQELVLTCNPPNKDECFFHRKEADKCCSYLNECNF